MTELNNYGTKILFIVNHFVLYHHYYVASYLLLGNNSTIGALTLTGIGSKSIDH